MRRLAKFAGEVLPLWPKAERVARPAPRQGPPRARRHTRPRQRQHTWLAEAGTWMCKDCLRTAHSMAARYRADATPCAGHAGSLSSVLGQDRSHRLVGLVTDLQVPTLFCLACGAWATKVPRKLLECCPGSMGPAGRDARKSIMERGTFPGARQRRVAVHGAFPLMPGAGPVAMLPATSAPQQAAWMAALSPARAALLARVRARSCPPLA